MEPASDSNLDVPLKGTEKALQLLLFPVPTEPKKVEETKESYPSSLEECLREGME